MMLWVVSLALWNLSPDKCYECGCGVLHCLPEVVLFSTRSILIQVADVIRIAMITLTLEWNIIPIYVINNVHPLNFTHDACTCIPHAHAGPELSRTVRSNFVIQEFFDLTEIPHIAASFGWASSICQDKNKKAAFVLLFGILSHTRHCGVAETLQGT